MIKRLQQPNVPGVKFRDTIKSALLMALLMIMAAMLLPPCALAETEEQQGRLYRTPQEQRDAGSEHEITSWLTISGLVETERQEERLRLENSGKTDHFADTATTLQMGLALSPLEWIKGEFTWEHDSNTDTWTTDEATLEFEYESMELVIGKQDLPFGVYFSSFSSGPLIEFGETKDDAIAFSYDHEELVDISLAVYRGVATRLNTNRGLDWSLAVEAWPTDSFSFGISYLSDLADSDERFLQDEGNRYEKKTPALSGFILWAQPRYEISLEFLGALRDFRELDDDRNRPEAWNLELVHILSSKFSWAVRLEGSRELEDEPEKRAGIALNSRLHQNIALTIEVLRGNFKTTLATDDDDNNYENITTYGIQLSVAL